LHRHCTNCAVFKWRGKMRWENRESKIRLAHPTGGSNEIRVRQGKLDRLANALP
jgi:hypothetical protein